MRDITESKGEPRSVQTRAVFLYTDAEKKKKKKRRKETLRDNFTTNITHIHSKRYLGPEHDG